jgi:hypothetical protein
LGLAVVVVVVATVKVVGSSDHLTPTLRTTAPSIRTAPREGVIAHTNTMATIVAATKMKGSEIIRSSEGFDACFWDWLGASSSKAVLDFISVVTGFKVGGVIF